MYTYIYIYIYIYVYAVYDFCYHTIQISTLWSAYIYIYININSYIMILYTCCDIKHACIHDFVYHAYVQFRNGDAIPQLPEDCRGRARPKR